METIKQVHLQNQVRAESEDMCNAFKDLNRWEQEMKEMEKQRYSEKPNESIPPIRTELYSLSKTYEEEEKLESVLNKNGSDELKTQDMDVSAQNIANSFKDKGNKHVKNGDYDQAIYYYTEAIQKFSIDPIFYTNRALCYLKKEKYNQCIDDCTKAINLDSCAIKAYYRRMQANESLDINEKALADCQKVLRLEPQNSEAISSLKRIREKLQGKGKISKDSKDIARPEVTHIKPKWTDFGKNVKEITPFIKSAHLRSKKPFKRVNVEDEIKIRPETTEEKDAKNAKNSCKINMSNIQESQDVKNNNLLANCSSEVKKVERVFLTPKSTGEFYVTWKELNTEEKYEYFKTIESSNINRILGACLDNEILADILSILSEFYVRDGRNVVKILLELIKHDEMKIIAFFISSSDRDCLNKLVRFMHENKDNEEDISKIQQVFGV